MRSELGGEKGLELVIQNGAKIVGDDVVVVAVADDDAGGVCGSHMLGYKPLFVANLQGLSAHARPNYEAGGAYCGSDQLPEVEKHNHVLLDLELADEMRVYRRGEISDLVKVDAGSCLR